MLEGLLLGQAPTRIVRHPWRTIANVPAASSRARAGANILHSSSIARSRCRIYSSSRPVVIVVISGEILSADLFHRAPHGGESFLDYSVRPAKENDTAE
jgi:hypothetical protein